MLDHEEKATFRDLLRALLELTHDLIKALKKYLAETPSSATTIRGDLMANYQLNTGDSVVVSLTYADSVTGAVVTPDASSVTAVLSASTDTVVVDPSQSFATITGGTTVGVGNTVTVNGTVNGVASTAWIGTYDDVAAVVAPDATAITGTFGTESAPTNPVPTVNPATGLPYPGQTVGTPTAVGTPTINPATGLPYAAVAPIAGSVIPVGGSAVTSNQGQFVGTAPVSILLASGRTIQAGTPLPADTKFVPETGELVNTDGTSYLG